MSYPNLSYSFLVNRVSITKTGYELPSPNTISNLLLSLNNNNNLRIVLAEK